MENITLLMHLAKKSRNGTIKTSTSELAEELGISQQSVSRKLRDMESSGLIVRNVSPRGHIIRIDSAGNVLLKRQYAELKSILREIPENSFAGTVESGIGEGRYYIGLEGYFTQFCDKLGFAPYPGTLNLKVPNYLEFPWGNFRSIAIDAFSTEDRTYGSIRCYKANINGIKGAIVFPERTHHSRDTVEVIAPVYLRKSLKLKDGKKLKIEVLE